MSLNNRGRIALNDNCYRHLGKPTAAYLYYSRADDLIAIEPLHSHRMPTAFDIKQNGASGWRIDAAPFCRHHNIRLDSTERFVAPEIEGPAEVADGRPEGKADESAAHGSERMPASTIAARSPLAQRRGAGSRSRGT